MTMPIVFWIDRLLVSYTRMYMFDLNRWTESADSMGDSSADLDQTCTFQCVILTGDPSKVQSA